MKNCLATLFAMTVFTTAAVAQVEGTKSPTSMGSPTRSSWSPPSSSTARSGGAQYRSFDFTLPVVTLSRQAHARLEYNMGGVATLSLEGARVVPGEDLAESTIEETGDSLKTDGMQGALLISRYSQGTTMSGFYWSLGAGYRQLRAVWKTKSEGDEEGTRMSLMDADGKLTRDLEVSGTTGHGRLGWRFVADSFPFLFGAHIGVRHFNATVRDIEDSELADEGIRVAPISDTEKKNLKRRMMTAFEPGVEVGLTF